MKAAGSTITLLALATLSHVAGDQVRQTKHTNDEFLTFTNLESAVEVTCKVAYYRAFDDQLIPAAKAQSMTNLGVNGVVLSIVEPKQFEGRVVAFHFDYPENWDSWYLPDFLYKGQVRTGYIGGLAFMCDPGCFAPEAHLLPSSNPEALNKLLLHPVWNKRFGAVYKEQFGETALFNSLYAFLTDTNRSPGQFANQKTAAKLLVNLQPACKVSAQRAVAETLSTWNESVSDWPLYLWRSFGREQLLQALEQIKSGKPDSTQQGAIEAWHYWLSGEEKDLVDPFGK
jgi:hypothetical protein